MASSPKIHFLLFFFSLYLIPLSISSSPHHSENSFSVSDIHDLFKKYNFPKGILPGNIKSYSFSSQDSSLKIELTRQCTVQNGDQMVYYDTEIEGKLFSREFFDVYGINARITFTWLPVTGIAVDESGNMIEFRFAELLSQRLPADHFQDIPSCI